VIASMLLVLVAVAAELPDVGPLDRYRVDVPDWPGAEVSSATGSVLLEPPPAGTPYRIEEAPVVDGWFASEGMDALAAWDWHAAGLTGAGVRVAVFDVQWFNAELWADELGPYETHDCQAHRSCALPMDTLRPRYSFEEGSHGVACAQAIRDLAPGVELHLVRVNGSTTLENAANWVVENDIDLVSMSMSFFNNSFYDGSGLVAEQAGRIRAGGSLLVGSVGNYAEEHWDGAWVDDDHDGDMDFPWGSSYLPVYLPSGTTSVVLTWDQFFGCGDTDFDAYVYDQDGVVVGRSERRQDPAADGCSPVERVSAHAADRGWHYLRVVRYAGDGAAHLSVFAREASVYQPTPGGIADPSASPATFSVGAVRAVGYAENPAEDFSSFGPTHGDVPKPDISGPDGLSSSVYGMQGFYGTSASAPAVTAALALLLERDPTLTPVEASELLQANAIDRAATWESGVDRHLGVGKARLPDPDAEPGCRGFARALLLMPLLGLRRRRGPFPRASRLSGDAPPTPTGHP